MGCPAWRGCLCLYLLTIEQRYPVLDLSHCTLIQGYFSDGSNAEDVPFVIAPDDPRFGDVIELLHKGAKFHIYEEGDFIAIQ